MRFWKKKFYKQVPCKACDSSGKILIQNVDVCAWSGRIIKQDPAYGICKYCNGRGTQTVLEREE